MIVTGEASGDMYGGRLAEKLKVLRPGIDLFGLGGKLMQAAGVRLLFDPTGLSAVGFAEALRSAVALREVLVEARRALSSERPSCLVLIDFPEFNTRLAGEAARRGVRSVYLFPPTAWAWRRGRARRIARTVTKVASVFPLEAEVYREAGASVEFVGHPLLDLVSPAGLADRQAAREELGLGAGSKVDTNAPIVGLLPGSRAQEMRLLLAPMLEGAVRIARARPGARFVLPLAETVPDEAVRKAVAAVGLPIRLVRRQAHECMAAADALVVASGTATLEATIVGTPMVVVYRVSRSTAALARLLLKIPYISWPNILARQRIVPELLQGEATGERIARETLRLLDDPASADEMIEGLAKARTALGSPGALERVARLVIEVARA
ncbi:MAG: lipid-A-disaccharide synthase [Firmicutes bacterium]|jgi:lipid-A-disaccharide synthase|nr:lipid-A-disaccharide synthase [Bacillota bacterium]MDH7494386.1 lipid-A-disaccharide synthase [Bacillota bacterium]